jgi:sodium/potassium-transporting ATPase subunit alpha
MFSQPLWSNKVLVAGIFQELALVLILAYVPPLNRVFKTRPIRFVHWLPGVPFAILTFVYDETRKYLVRRGDAGNSKLGRWVRDNSYW